MLTLAIGIFAESMISPLTVRRLWAETTAQANSAKKIEIKYFMLIAISNRKFIWR